MRAVLASLVLLAATALSSPAVPLDGPVDVDELLRVTRAREAMTSRLVYKYVYRQTTTIEVLDEAGHVKETEVSVYDVLPTPDGTERYLVSKDGREPTRSEVRKQEKRNAKLKERWENIRERQLAAAMKAQAERERAAGKAKRSASKAPAVAPPATPPATVRGRPIEPAASTPAAPTAAPAAVTPTIDPAPAPPSGAAPVSAELGTRPGGTVVPPQAPATPAAIPPCDEEDARSAVRPPFPGSRTRSTARPSEMNEAARRTRERASDYSLFELLTLTDYEYAGTCIWRDRPMHVIAFEPEEGFDPLNPVERVVSAMRGTILVDAAEMEVSRAQGRLVAPIAWGAGMVKLNTATILFEHDRIQDETWLPVRDVFEFDSRVLLARERERITHVFDEFKKAQVSSEQDVGDVVVEEPIESTRVTDPSGAPQNEHGVVPAEPERR